MTFAQILVLTIVVCVSAVECVVALARASVMKKKIGVPSDRDITNNVVGALIEADSTGSMVTIRFGAAGTEIIYIPQGADDEPVQTGD